MSDPAYPSPTLRIEQLFCTLLSRSSALAAEGVPIVCASDRSARVPPTHIFVAVDKARPITSTGPLYLAELRVVVVTHTDDDTNEDRQRLADATRAILANPGGPVQEADAAILGFTVGPHREASEDQQTGDVFPIIAGLNIAG